MALTFDAGADRGYAVDILDLLRDQHLLATFGVTGKWAKANPDLVQRMAAEHHLVVNHTDDHRSFTGWTVDSLGWKHLAAADIVRRCLDRAAPGAVYIFHVGGASQDHLALERIIPALRERGFGFTTIDRG
ncbi:MAG: polysaccharide deacetylase family protein [Chloroflexi bacterium]|nr:polysaccharide deacetylase family protein [Chloroflexota bacterium]